MVKSTSKTYLLCLSILLGGCNVREWAVNYADKKADDKLVEEKMVIDVPPANPDPDASIQDILAQDWEMILIGIYVLIRRRIPQISNLLEGQKRVK